MLESIGLTTWEERLYLALLESGPATVPEVADRLGVERRRASGLVQGLERSGLVSRTPGQQPRVVPAPPDIAVTALLLQRQRELQEVASSVGPLTERYRRSPRERSAEELIEVCVGREAVVARFEQLQRAAAEQVRTFVMRPYAVGSLDENDTEFELLQKGVQYRGLYHTDVLREAGGDGGGGPLRSCRRGGPSLGPRAAEARHQRRRPGPCPDQLWFGRDELHPRALMRAAGQPGRAVRAPLGAGTTRGRWRRDSRTRPCRDTDP